MSPITSNPNLTVHVCLLKGIKNEQTDEQNRSITKEKYLQGDIYLLVFYGITARHAHRIFLCVNKLAHMACGVAICAHEMCLKTENYDIFYQIWKLKLKVTIKCQNQDERTSSLLPFLLNPQTSLERPAGLKTNRQRYFVNQTKSMKITEITTQKWKWNSFTHSRGMPHPTRVEVSLSLQPWFFQSKRVLRIRWQGLCQAVNETSFGISKVSNWCFEHSKASHFSQQIGLRKKNLLAYILVVFGYLDLKFCMLVPDVIALTVLKKNLAIRNSHFNLQEYLNIYITWGGAWGHVDALISLMHEGKTCIYQNPLFLLYVVIHGLFFIHCHPQTSIIIYALFYLTLFQFLLSLSLYETQPDIGHDGTQTSKHQATIYNRE